MARACDTAILQTDIATMQSTAQQILAVGFVLPDPVRRNPANIATFNTIVSAINDAGTALSANDLATTSSKVGFVSDTLNALLANSVDFEDGTESSLDLALLDAVSDANTLVAGRT